MEPMDRTSLPIGGLDLSLTDTGIAVVDLDGSIAVQRTRSAGKMIDSLAVKARRFEQHADAIVAIVAAVEGCGDVVIESPAYGMAQGAADFGGLRWLVLTRLVAAGHRVHEINPMHVKKYATGETRADKDVVAMVVRRYPQADVTNNNTADAVVLVAMLARHLGRTLEQGALSQTRQDAFDKVAWSA